MSFEFSISTVFSIAERSSFMKILRRLSPYSHYPQAANRKYKRQECA